MATSTRKNRKRTTLWRGMLRLLFVLFLLSMLAAYISNQVAISSKRAELQTLQEQIAQQQAANEERQLILPRPKIDKEYWFWRLR